MGKEELLTVKEATEFLKVTRQTLYKLRKEGELKAIKIGSKILFRLSDLTELINNNVENINKGEKNE